jgi:hypothetical protein
MRRFSRALMEILYCLLSRSNTQITMLVNVTRTARNSGYNLLGRVLYLTVPGFNPVKPICIPIWQDNNIFEFTLSFSLYYRLEAKRGILNNDCTRSITFLNTIQDPGYTDIVSTLMSHIQNYYAKDNNGYLPINLCLMGLPTQLCTSAQTRASTVVPCIRRALGLKKGWEFDASIQGSPWVARADGGPPWGGYDRPPPCGGRDWFPPHEDCSSCKPQGASPIPHLTLRTRRPGWWPGPAPTWPFCLT